MDKFGVAPECAGAESEGVQILRAVFSPSMMVNVQADAQSKRGRCYLANTPRVCVVNAAEKRKDGDQHRPPSTFLLLGWQRTAIKTGFPDELANEGRHMQP